MSSFKNGLIVFAFFLLITVVDAVGQTRPNGRVQDISLVQVKELRGQSMNDAANRMIASLRDKRNDNGMVSLSQEANLEFESLVNGLRLNEFSAINKSIRYIHSAENKLLTCWLSFHLGTYYFEQGNFNEALLYLELTDPLYFTNAENELIQFQKGVAYFSQRKFDNAKPYFRSIQQLPTGQYSTEVSYYLGCIQLSEKDYAGAIVLFESIQTSSRYAAVASYQLGLANYQLNRYEKALGFIDSYLRSGDDSYKQDANVLIASLYFHLNRYSEVVQAYDQLIQAGLTPSSIQAFQWGASNYYVRRSREAIQILEPLTLSKDSIGRNALFLLANAYLELKQFNKSWSAFQLCISSQMPEPQLELCRFNFAKLSFELGFLDRAVQSMEFFLREYPGSASADEGKLLLLEHYAKTNNYKLAINELARLQSALTATHRDIAARIYFGRAMELLQDLNYDASIDMLQQLEAYPSSSFYAPSLFWRAELAYRKGRYEQCIQLMLQFLRAFSIPEGAATQYNAYYTLGYCYFEKEEYAKAQPYFDKLNGRNVDEDLRREAILRSADCSFMLKNISRAKQLYASIKDTQGYGTDYAFFQLSLIEGIRSVPGKIAMLKSMESQFPTSDYRPLLMMELADTYMAEEEFGSALLYLSRLPGMVEAEDEIIPDIKLKTGICLLNLERLDEALSYFGDLIRNYPSSGYASEALDNARSVYLEKRDINGYQSFLSAQGRSISSLQKDSLSYQIVRDALLDGPTDKAVLVMEQYENDFRNGIFISDVLNAKAELLLKDKNWRAAAVAFDSLAQKGVTKFQERALRQAGKLYFFELKDYGSALRQFSALSRIAVRLDILLESLRGEVRCHYYLNSWNEGAASALKLLEQSSAGEDDLSYANLILGHYALAQERWVEAQSFFENTAKSRIASLASESNYLVAYSLFRQGQLTPAEEKCLSAIEQSGSNDQWSIKMYVLLSRIFMAQGDYFNAKATIQSVLDQVIEPAIRSEADSILKEIQRAEIKK